MISELNVESLRSKLVEYRRIVITGASGWLGQETTQLLANVLGDEFEKRVILVSSTPKKLKIKHKTIVTLGWSDFNSIRDVDLLIHFSFLNQDKASLLGFAKYVETNRRITSDLEEFLIWNPGCAVLLASSGAAQHFRGDINSDNSMEVYAALKLESERSILENNQTHTVLIMRIWSVTGSGLNLGAPYAIANFFQQGMLNSRIDVTGNGASSRAYLDVKEMMLAFLLSLSKGKKLSMDSGGFVTSFSRLAQKVSASLNLPPQSVRLLGENKPVSNYIPNVAPFNSAATSLEIALSDIDSQIEALRIIFLES